MVEEVALTGRPAARVPIEVSAPEDGVPLVHGDDDQLRRSLTNLVDNASRHARSAVQIGVRAEPGVVIVELANDGDPIPAADLERIFTRFSRLDDARARDAGGSGLGLAIARDVARRLGGELIVARSDAAGTAFRLTLPVSR